MGNTESSDALLETPLHPIDYRVVSLDAKFCVSIAVSLQLQQTRGTWLHTDYTVRHAATSHETLRLDGSTLSMSDHKALVDASSGQTMAHLRHAHLTLNRQLRVCADRDGCQELFVIKSTANRKAEVEFTNRANNGERVKLAMQGDWRAAIVYMEQENGQRLSVARICRPKSSQEFYCVDVAPNMDQLVVVLLCVLLDERKKDADDAMRATALS